MRWISQMMMVTAALVPVSARAADWWFITGEPEDDALLFADAETVVRRDAQATVHVQRIEKSGQAIETVARVQCEGPQQDTSLRRFVCSTDERLHLGIMLGDKTPRQTAQMIFAMRSSSRL